MRARAYLIILAVFAVINALFWSYTYRAATAPAPEELARAAAIATPPPPSTVTLRGDGYAAAIPLTGECTICRGAWRYRQTGRELTPAEGGPAFFDPAFDASAWRTMVLPQNWWLAGLNDHGVVWFRQEFDAAPDWQGRAVQLRFDGVDYQADVWLNGEKLGAHTGYFQPFAFEISDRLYFTQTNTLMVRVDSPYENYPDVWPNRKTLVKGILGQDKARPGGAWSLAGQAYNTGGIWGGIWLDVRDGVVIDDVRIAATWPATVTADVTATVTATEIMPGATGGEATVEAQIAVRNFTDESVTAEVQLVFIPRNFDGPSLQLAPQTVTLPRGATDVTIRGAVSAPTLWQPWDRGAPNLYTAQATVRVASGSLAEHEAPFGFRQVLIDDGWRWTVNGQPYFVRGANYISSQWLSQVDEAWLRRDLDLARAANLNLVRVQAHVEPPAFYTLADELGLLVWQDFPLQWGYTDAPAFIDEAQRQAAAMISQLYNHPSIVLWAMHNESPWQTPKLATQVKEYDARQNKRLDELLAADARRLDPTRYVLINSGGSDQHIYVGWDEAKWSNYADLPGAPFVSEYGAQALPSLRALFAMFGAAHMTYATGETRTRWEFHDFQPRPTFDVAGVETGASTAEFVANSQAYQANLLKFATESYRRAKYAPMQGIIQYMFTDAWPAITWAVLEYDRTPKLGYTALQSAMQPVLPSVAAPLPTRLDGTRWVYAADARLSLVLWVVNDLTARFDDAVLRWTLFDDATGAQLYSDARPVDIAPDSVKSHAILDNVLPTAPGRYRLEVDLVAGGATLGANSFVYEREATPDAPTE